MATPRATGGTTRQRLFASQAVATPTLSSGPGQGMAWLGIPDASPLANLVQTKTPLDGGVAFTGVPRTQADGVFQSTGAAYGGVEHLRSND